MRFNFIVIYIMHSFTSSGFATTVKILFFQICPSYNLLNHLVRLKNGLWYIDQALRNILLLIFLKFKFE
jgi:hypothetical protein